jgi:hypothetical protein
VRGPSILCSMYASASLVAQRGRARGHGGYHDHPDDDAALIQRARLIGVAPEAQRTQIAFALQRSVGNAAVARMLQRPTGPISVQRCGSERHEGCACAGPTREKGDPVDDDETKTDKQKAGGSVPIQFELEEATSWPEPGTLAKHACPGSATPSPKFPQAKSTAAARAAMGACNWGITKPDKLKVRTKTCKDGTDWSLRVTGITSKIRKFSRLLPAQKEPNTRRARSGNFCDMTTELDALGTCAGAWYSLRAVKAHENVHVGEWKSSFPSDWPPLQVAIEGITVPASGATKSKAKARKAMRSSATFTAALNVGTANFPTFWAIPDPNGNTDAAERAVVDPKIVRICKHAKKKGWSPAACAPCNARGIT